MRLLITGATGYIGERLARYALAQGHEVIAATRRSPGAGVEWMPFDLSDTAEIVLPAGIKAVFHLATITNSDVINPDLEVAAARRLIKASAQAGARMVFVSSQTAREGAPTAYGRTKWRIEREVLAAGGWIVRPGQVYGGPERALFGTLTETMRKLPVVPAFFPCPEIQPVHVDDLVVALFKVAGPKNTSSSMWRVGAVEPVSFTNFLRTIARERVRRVRVPVPVPVVLVRLAGIILGERLRKKLGLDQLMSLFDLPRMETAHDLQSLGVSLRPLSSGMTRSGNGRRRNLIREGRALLIYVLKLEPTSSLLRRYVRCIEQVRDGQAIHLPEFALRAPLTIALLDDRAAFPTPMKLEFTWRLNAAVVLAEASVQGARRFLGLGETVGVVIGLARMTRAVALELWWRVSGWVCAPLLKPVLRKSGLSK